jgi:hypothetical protein
VNDYDGIIQAASEGQDIVKVSFKCPASYKQEFKDSHCLLIISVGQKAHEGDIFLSTIQLINNNFKECTILVADSLQRYTLAIETDNDADSLYQQSMREGDLWLERNKKLYARFTIPYNIVRWDRWLMHPQYMQERAKVDNLYTSNFDVEEAFKEVITKFIKRYEVRMDKTLSNYHQTFQNCLNYLQEECAVMSLRAQEGYDFEIYPSGRNPAMEIIYACLVHLYLPEISRSVSLYIRTQRKLLSKQIG